MVLRAEECAKAVALVEDERSQRYVARVLNASHSTIQRVLARLRETGTNIRIPGCVETKRQLREVRGTEIEENEYRDEKGNDFQSLRSARSLAMEEA
ncbi:hypothetical protein ILUMI_16763 [Ignelater luminosus]|uniref:Uncharacterized protein n=1 Tax=Ignelater luminosus TaxID=2038154 RepID=A0A8K0G878_IGNLU|nr:hypothetical protein ILUMI_16763 [Ignelater luminosus]